MALARLTIFSAVLTSTLLGMASPVSAGVKDHLPDVPVLTPPPDQVEVGLRGGDIIIDFCNGEGEGPLVYREDEGEVIIYLPTGQYLGWATPCPS